MVRVSLAVAWLSAGVPAALVAQQPTCPNLTFGDLTENPVTGDHRGTEIILADGQSGCVALVKIGEGRMGPTLVGTPDFRGDTLHVRLTDGRTFRGRIVGDTLLGSFDAPGAPPLRLPRLPGPTQLHEH